MRSTVVAVMFAAVIAFKAAAACEAAKMRASGDVATDPAALRVCWKLLEQARMGFSHLEAAAFLVRDAAGNISGVPWPEADEPNSGRWIGAFPPNVVAIVHTHPNWMPKPSTIDVLTAVKTRVPVYVVTRSHIAKTADGSITMVVDGEWKPGDLCSTRGGDRRRFRTRWQRGSRSAPAEHLD